MRCLWSWWSLQYLLFFLLSTGVLIGFGHCKEESSLICIRTYSIGITRGVKLVNLGFLFGSSFFFPIVCPTIRVSFFLSRLLLVPSSLFLFPFISFVSTASSTFMYFWVLQSNSTTVFGGLLVIEKKKSPSSNLAWKVVKITWSSASSTYSSSLLNRVSYYLSDSPSTYWMLRRWPVGFLCLCPPMKWRTKPLLSCSKSTIVPGGICWTIPWLLLSVWLGIPNTSSRLGSSAIASVSWMIRCDPRDPWNRHMTPTMEGGILVGGDGSVLQ